MDLLQQVLAVLGAGGPTQQQRLLRLHTPLGADVLLAERAEVAERIAPAHGEHAGFCIRMTALSVDDTLALDALIGQPVLLELLTADSRTALRPWHGHVSQCALLGSDGGLARYELTIEPWLAFLRWRTDSFVFQHMTVVQIVEAVFARHAGQGRLVPQWRWALADAGVYPQRSLCIQYRESDLDFVTRLLAEEGLFCWFEHAGDAAADSLGAHTLVIADHNGAFGTAATARPRYTQSGAASFSEDGLQRWHRARRVRTQAVALASWDYRSVGLRPVNATAAASTGVPLAAVDVPGQYAYEDSPQGQRLAAAWLQALQAPSEQWQGEGTVRGIAPGSTFELLDHPGGNTGPFVALALTHHARNNLDADAQAGLRRWLGDLPHWAAGPLGRLANAGEEPLYRLQLTAQRSALPVRAPATARGLLARPLVHGTQTALVVGLDAPVHTDRDHRVKIQFHWQRGSASSHGLAHDQGCNAPGDDAAGTWVRVSEALAGANWGSHFAPRLGQEVVVAFTDGDIDRPVVVGAVYNGIGQAQVTGAADAQGNQVAGGRAGASANAPAWFPGTQAQGTLQAHQHAAVFTGMKSQELSASAQGSGGHNQWVFDGSNGAHRIELSSTTAATRLQLGHLLMQRDNQRLQRRGHGVDLASAAHGALRAGAGLLLSAHARQPSTGSSQQMDSREVQRSLQTAQALAHTLADSAQRHQALQPAEPAPQSLPAAMAQAALLASMAATQNMGADGDASEPDSIGGGRGTVAAFARPDIAIAAPAGIGSFTPASMTASAGATVNWVAGQDLTCTTQRHHSSVVKDGIVWFTYGKARNPNKPNTETGIRLHAATGSVSVQAASARSVWAADRAVEIASTTDAVTAGSPQQVLLAAGGSTIRITSGSITLTTAGPATFRAAMKELAGGSSASANLHCAKPGALKLCEFRAGAAANGGDALVLF